MPFAHPVPARPRPDSPLEAVPPAEGQDPGLHRSRRRPLPDADDSHARDDRDRPWRDPGVAVERRPDRGDRPRARHGAYAVRSCGRGGLVKCLSERFGTGFRHNEQSHRIAEELNLTWEVRDGILKHTGEVEPETLEGKIVRIVDRVAYINHDIDDAIRHGILRAEE